MGKITVKAIVNANVEKTWEYYTSDQHIINWNNASDDWHSPSASNDLRVGGKFINRMEAKDGSAGFDFTGTYTAVEPQKLISYVLDDKRAVDVTFDPSDEGTKVTVTFDAEQENSVEMQQAGWQAILDNFKRYTEGA